MQYIAEQQQALGRDMSRILNTTVQTPTLEQIAEILSPQAQQLMDYVDTSVRDFHIMFQVVHEGNKLATMTAKETQTRVNQHMQMSEEMMRQGQANQNWTAELSRRLNNTVILDKSALILLGDLVDLLEITKPKLADAKFRAAATRETLKRRPDVHRYLNKRLKETAIQDVLTLEETLKGNSTETAGEEKQAPDPSLPDTTPTTTSFPITPSTTTQAPEVKTTTAVQDLFNLGHLAKREHFEHGNNAGGIA